MIIDISPEISQSIAVFPGDTPFSKETALSFENGDHLMLSSINSTVHLGAHTDAPCHYSKNGDSIEKAKLDNYVGPSQVIEININRGQRILPEHLNGQQILAPRILFKTNSFPDPNNWNDDFNALSAELIDYLHHEGVFLVGIDTPSVDLANDQDLLSHTKIAEFELSILEGIVLKDVPEGLYELIALPLPLKGLDASPVRAILRSHK